MSPHKSKMPPNRNTTHRNLVLEGSRGATSTLAPTREFFEDDGTMIVPIEYLEVVITKR
jgi:hypothetical protein